MGTDMERYRAALQCWAWLWWGLWQLVALGSAATALFFLWEVGLTLMGMRALDVGKLSLS
jgi:hypothetical protein